MVKQDRQSQEGGVVLTGGSEGVADMVGESTLAPRCITETA